MRQHWLLVRLRGVERDSLRTHSSTRRPSLQPGDRALCYAAGWKAIFAVVEIGAPFEHDPARERWGWRMPLRPLLVLDDLRDAPPVEAAGVWPRSLGRHSYIRLTAEQFEAGHTAIAEAADALQ